ncbi:MULTISPECIES: hemerythrin domain-containing protein [Allobacillus]|uniref:Hemerythrin domain-containing protein n=1 Tax=Allobacillus halotolerans TaxID=570278 RepID=A0ABS6GRH9_9BACI|nr:MULTISPECIES: hemerythrin domain-containing protein [Allobacillus]MBU6081722.1 hemerythrin domain-containing protein [Allobacillus halotolerans]TSJ66594.1 hemerythrin domain-containing protein [Allobacillus sp. SKP2-8]
MKRHEGLFPLSHHHHHALVISKDLKDIGTSKGEKTYKIVLRELVEFWEKDGNEHFRDEEEVLIPLYLRFESEPNVDLVKKVLYQHAEIRGLITAIRNNQQADHEQLNLLGHLLDEHIRLEERELFPVIEEAVPEKYLYQASGKFHNDSYSGY